MPVTRRRDRRLTGKRVLLRGLENARNEWNLIAGCHNLLKLFTKQSRTPLAAPAGT